MALPMLDEMLKKSRRHTKTTAEISKVAILHFENEGLLCGLFGLEVAERLYDFFLRDLFVMAGGKKSSASDSGGDGRRRRAPIQLSLSTVVTGLTRENWGA